jgi:hypothetical protein
MNTGGKDTKREREREREQNAIINIKPSPLSHGLLEIG